MRASRSRGSVIARLGVVVATIGVIVATMSPAANANPVRQANSPAQIDSTAAYLHLSGRCWIKSGYVRASMSWSTDGPSGTAYLNIYKRVNTRSYLIIHYTKNGWQGGISAYTPYSSASYWFATWGFNSSAVSGSGGGRCPFE